MSSFQDEIDEFNAPLLDERAARNRTLLFSNHTKGAYPLGDGQI